MRVYRMNKNGVEIWRLFGTVGREDVHILIHSMIDSDACSHGIILLDLENVDHVNYAMFQMLESRLPHDATVLLAGMNDYLLDIFAFVRKKRSFAIYPDWNVALSCLASERHKFGAPFTLAAVGYE